MTSGTLIIIQARTGASRFPDKTVLDFFRGKGIFEIILENLVHEFGAEGIVLATTIRAEDDRLAAIGVRAGIKIFRGSESDVLGRFIAAAKAFGGKRIVRVCADNPFLLPACIRLLLEESENARFDYLSFRLTDGTPVIRSHWGLFAEVTTIDALEKVNASTQEPFYHEHVTNYMYEHPEHFSVSLLPLPAVFRERSSYRFTLDTEADFRLLRDLYINLFRLHHTTVFTPEQIFRFLDNAGTGARDAMLTQINKNAK